MGIEKDLDEAKEDQERIKNTLAKYRQIAKDQRTTKELRSLIRSLTDQVEGLSLELSAVLGMAGQKPLRIPKPKATRKNPIWPCAMLSDQHLEERVELVQTAGLNKHDLVISEARNTQFFERSAVLFKERDKIQSVAEIGLWLGGDHITGHIHKDLEQSAELSPLRAIEEAHRRLKGGIEYLLSELKVDRIYIPTNWGNHGKVEPGRPRISTMHEHNLEQAMFRSLARDFAGNDRVKFDVTDSAFKYVEVGCIGRPDFVIRTNHGDDFKYGGGLAGMTAPLSNFTRKMDQERVADLNIYGHWHVKQDLAAVRSLINGSTIGHSAYSRRYGYQVPEQTFFWIDLERGLKAGDLPIWVT